MMSLQALRTEWTFDKQGLIELVEHEKHRRNELANDEDLKKLIILV
jgi:hypothetical protein